MCVCVRERGREGGREGGYRPNLGGIMCVCVRACVCVGGREREGGREGERGGTVLTSLPFNLLL